MGDIGWNPAADGAVALQLASPSTAPNPASKQDPRRRQFHKDIRAYSRTVLAPLGLRPPRDVTVICPPALRRYTLIGRSHVWKFYRPGVAHLASNFQKTAELAREAGVAVPEVIYCDASDEAVETFRLACLVMKKLPGSSLDPSELSRQARPLARLISRLHSVSSDRRGLLVSPIAGVHSPPALPSWLEETEEYIAHCETLAGRLGIEAPKGLQDAAAHLFDRLPVCPPPYQLLHGDLSYHNIMRSRAGDLTLIDLDLASFDFFGNDLIRLLIRRQSLLEPGIGGSPEEILNRCEQRLGSLFADYFSLHSRDRYEIWRETRVPLMMLYGLKVYHQLLKWAILKKRHGTAAKFRIELANAEKVRAVLGIFATGSRKNSDT